MTSVHIFYAATVNRYTCVKGIILFWYPYVYPKNLGKQDEPKLIVAQTVPSLRVCFDQQGRYALDNVRVDGILSANAAGDWFLLGILNSPVPDFVFRRIAKPKHRSFFEANRQFIAPLPIPAASTAQREDIIRRAQGLQALHSQRRDLLQQITRRLDTVKGRKRPETWLFAGLRDLGYWIRQAPPGCDAAEQEAWAQQQHAAALAERYAAIDARLLPGAVLTAELRDGELCLLADGVPLIDRVFLDSEEAAFVRAQWQVLASRTRINEGTKAQALCDQLRALAPTEDSPAQRQIMALAERLAVNEGLLDEQEARMNEAVFALYRLSDVERELVMAGRRGWR